MLLRDIYDQLAHAELKQMQLGHGDIGALDNGLSMENFKDFLPLVRGALTDLHTRFALRRQEVAVNLQAGQMVYVFTKAFALSNTASQEAVKYLDDTAEPMGDSFMRVEQIYGTYLKKGYRIPFNNPQKKDGIRSTRYNSIVVPTDTEVAPWLLETTSLRVVYAANHPAIATPDPNENLGDLSIELPPSFLMAMVYFIAARVTNPLGASGEFHEGNNYHAKYLGEVQLLKGDGQELDDQLDNDKAADRGFI